ncbi:MAG: hypothetical protein JJE21_02065 [Spirochaetaceae bacterium]|nr:hypothetical protein [Spirochaetaceae bacterium]
MKVTIISAERNSGKTTFAKNLISKNKNGFLGFLSYSSPSKDSFYLYDINNSNTIVLMSEKVNDNYERIGRFYIEPFAFDKAYDSLINQIGAFETKKCIVIDEVGQLELDGYGFDRLINRLIELDENLLLCIRKCFVESVVFKYGFVDYTLIDV